MMNSADEAVPTLAARILIVPVLGYRRFISPLLPPTCRFAPVEVWKSGDNIATAKGPEAGFKSVSTGPGWTLLTVMPRGPRSRASPRVRPAMAALVIA